LVNCLCQNLKKPKTKNVAGKVLVLSYHGYHTFANRCAKLIYEVTGRDGKVENVTARGIFTSHNILKSALKSVAITNILEQVVDYERIGMRHFASNLTKLL
jgi:hypothetical protein